MLQGSPHLQQHTEPMDIFLSSYHILGLSHLLVSTIAVLIVFVVQQVSGKRSHWLDITSNNFIQVFKLL